MEPEVHYRVHKRPPLDTFLCQMSSVHILLPCLFKIYFNTDNVIKRQKIPSVFAMAKDGKSKGKVVHVLFLAEHHAMKAYWGSGCIAPQIFDLGIRWR
jgi:hypothetical protein